MKGKALRGNTITYGEYGLMAMEPTWITANQIEAARVVINRTMRRGGKVWVKIFPDKPVTQKPAETRMGSGKGSPEYWVAVVKPGRVMFELAGAEEEVARRALQLAAYKLPIKCKIVSRAEQKAEQLKAAGAEGLVITDQNEPVLDMAPVEIEPSGQEVEQVMEGEGDEV